MEINRCTMQSFSVIGKEGSSYDGEGFVKKLWDDANAHFGEVAALAARDENGNLLGVWGLMSDLTGEFLPWEEGFTKGRYLAGVQAANGAEVPESWVKWTIPAFEYLYVKVEGDYGETFSHVLGHIADAGMELGGAVQEYYCPEENGQLYLFFPVGRVFGVD